jgi:YD repeat-containing protein
MSAKFTNNATATLAASLSTSSTSITVTTSQGALFPTLGAGDYFFATLTNSSNNIEVVKITARASDTLTAVRAQEGTTALTWNAADKLELRITSAVLTNFAQQDSPNTFAGAMTYGGVTLSNAVTGTGNMVLSASPALTGVPTAPTAASGTSTTQIASTAFANAAFQNAYPVGSIYMNASVATNPATLFGFGTWSAFGAGRVLLGDGTTNTVTAGGFTIGSKYTIVSIGTTNFVSIGASANTVGVVFTATGVGTGTGTADTTFVAASTGGSADAIVVSHTHNATVTDPQHTHTLLAWHGAASPGSGGGADSGQRLSSNTTATTAAASTGISVSNSTVGSSGTNANYQPYITVYMWQRTA